MAKLLQTLENMHLAWKGLLLALAIGAVLATAASLPARVSRLETQTGTLQAGMRYLVCRAIEVDAGREPRACARLLDDLDELLKAVRP